MKILMLAWKDLNHPKKGGAEVVTDIYLKSLVKSGHEVTLFTAKYKDSKSQEKFNGYKIIRNGNSLSVYPKGLLYATKNQKDFDIIIDQVNTIPFFTPLTIKKEKRVAFFHQLCKNIWFYEKSFPLSAIGYLAESLYLKLYATTKTLTWNVYTVSPGEKGTITFEVIILEREECGDFEISNFFRAWSDQEEWKESNTIIVNVKDECPPEPFCGDDICNNGETCSTCPEDCGACPPIPPCDCCPCPGCYISDCYCSTNECDCGGEVIINPEEEDEEECNEKCEDEEECNEDNSDNLKIFCETNWKCSQWGECVNGFITRECFDENQCDTVYNKPYEQSACNEQVLSTQYVEKKVANLNWIWIALGIILFIALLIILILLIA